MQPPPEAETENQTETSPPDAEASEPPQEVQESAMPAPVENSSQEQELDSGITPDQADVDQDAVLNSGPDVDAAVVQPEDNPASIRQEPAASGETTPFSDGSSLQFWIIALIIGVILVLSGLFLVNRA